MALVVCSAAGCGPEPGDRAPVAPPLWTASRLHTIGSIDGPEQVLTRVTRVLLGPEDELIIAQPDESTLRRFDAEGRYLGRIGRRGEGPGEIGGLRDMGLDGDELWILDQGNGRLTRYGLDGRFVSDRRWSPDATYQGRASFNYAFPLRLRLRPDSTLLAIPGVLLVLQEGETHPPVAPPVVTLGLDGGIRDTVLLQSLEPATPVADGVLDMFPTNPEYDLTSDGERVVVVERPIADTDETGAFRLLLVGLAGDTAVDRSYRYTPRRTPDALEDEIFLGLSETLQRAYRGKIQVPPRYPPVTDLVVGQGGTIWLERERVGTEPVEWWAIEETTGDPLGRVELPPGHTVMTSRGSTLITSHQDELEVTYLTRWVLERR